MGCPRFEYPHRWPVIGTQAVHVEGADGLLTPRPLDPNLLALLDDRDRAIEDFVSGLPCKQGGGALRFATKTVGASNRLDTDATHYDYVCTGSGDETVIQAALNALDPAVGGKVLLSEGLFSINNTITLPPGAHLQGMGQAFVADAGLVLGTVIQASNSFTSNGVMLSTSAAHSQQEISDLRVDTAANYAVGISASHPIIIRRINVTTTSNNGNGAINLGSSADGSYLYEVRCATMGGSDFGLAINGSKQHHLIGCQLWNVSDSGGGSNRYQACQMQNVTINTGSNSNVILGCVITGNVLFGAATTGTRYGANWIQGTITDNGTNINAFNVGSNFNP